MTTTPSLTELRAKRHLTMRGLADESGVTTATVFHIEHGNSMPLWDTCRKLAVVLACRPEAIREAALIARAHRRPAKAKA